MKPEEKEKLNKRLTLLNKAMIKVAAKRDELQADLKRLTWERNKIVDELKESEKPNLRRAFSDLRKAGYFARMNFWCCQSCGWAAVPDEKADKAVFYSNQDNEELKTKGRCFLTWDGDPKEIINILQENNIMTEWKGSPNSRILIDVNYGSKTKN